MRSLPLALVALVVPSVLSIKIPFRRLRQASSSPINLAGNPYLNLAVSGSPGGTDLTSSHDLIYISDITIAGQSYAVQLDTGSSDLWVATSGGLSGSGVTTTNLQYNLTYAIGYAFGPIVQAPVSFAGFTISSQALVSATTSTANNPVLSLGAAGVLGFGFDSMSAVQVTAAGAGQNWGHSLLYNIFTQDPSTPNIISFLLSRDDDPNSPPTGTFTIGEYDDAYAAIANSPQIPTLPATNPSRWSAVLNGFASNGKKYTISSSVNGVPSGSALMLVDSGTTFNYAPQSVVNAIYKGAKGATFNSGLGQWVLPCDTEIDVSLFIGSQQIDLHPLDIVVQSNDVPQNMCVGTFIPLSLGVAAGTFDWLIGDFFFRSVYTVYNFGNIAAGASAKPFIQFLQLESAATASAEFRAVRGGGPPNITNGTLNTPPTPGGSTAPLGGASGGGGGDGGSSMPDTSMDETIAKVLNYMPIILGILGVQAAVLLSLVIVGLLWLCRGKRGKGRKRISPEGSFQMSTLSPTQGYRPVSTVGDKASTYKSIGPASPVSLHGGSSPPLLAPPVPHYESSTLPIRNGSLAVDMDMQRPNSTVF